MTRFVLAPLLLCLALGLLGAAPAGAAAPAGDGTAARATGLPSKDTWLRDVTLAMKGSPAYLRKRAAARKPGQRLAVVLDIDNTSLASHYAWPRPVKKVRTFARRARALGMTVHFATGRTSDQLGDTPTILREAGYDYRSICVRRSSKEPLEDAKLRCRKALEKKGYRIVAMVGNRSTDFLGGHYRRGFKLPDYGGRLS